MRAALLEQNQKSLVVVDDVQVESPGPRDVVVRVSHCGICHSDLTMVDAGGAALGGIGPVVEHYMRQSEQLDTTLVLAADDNVAAGLLLQRLPVQGQHNLAQSQVAGEAADETNADDPFERLSLLARSLKREELLGLDADTVLHRLFWQEPLRRFEPAQGSTRPRFACSCSRERVAAMLKGLGQAEVDSIVHEQGQVEVSCDFCGQQERFDAVDVARLFTPAAQQSPLPGSVQ